MLRLAPPGFERFLQSPQFVATFGEARRTSPSRWRASGCRRDT